MSYVKIGEITEGVREALIAYAHTNTAGQWEECVGENRNYRCWNASSRIMFVKIPAGGRVDCHRDKPAKGKRLNIVLQTNAHCLNWHVDGLGFATAKHLDERGIYAFDATQEHWARNDGDTDRIVLVETLP